MKGRKVKSKFIYLYFIIGYIKKYIYVYLLLYKRVTLNRYTIIN